jgi:hypothetical protein
MKAIVAACGARRVRAIARADVVPPGRERRARTQANRSRASVRRSTLRPRANTLEGGWALLGRHSHWVKAMGRVVAVDRHSTTVEGGRPASYDTGYVIDVRSPDGEPFRAEVLPAGHYIGHLGIESFNFKHPNKGDIVSVEYDPASKKVRFDMSDPALQEKASRDAHEAAHDAAAHAQYEEALNARLPRQSAKRVAGAQRQPANEPVAEDDQLDRLEELAKLHQDGVLTDEEFPGRQGEAARLAPCCGPGLVGLKLAS